jgi:hypothetical protein
VTATNPAGSVAAVTGALPVRHAPPVAVAVLPDVVHDAGSGPQAVATAGAFAGAALVFAVEGAGAAIDAATGVVTLATDVARRAAVTVTASNSGGAATASFLASVTAAPGAPAPVGALGALAYEQGSGARTVSAQALFAGEGIAYRLEAAPAGVTVNPGSGLVRIPTDRLFEAAAVLVRAENALGAAEQAFTVAVRTTGAGSDTVPPAAQAGDWDLDQITVQA